MDRERFFAGQWNRCYEYFGAHPAPGGGFCFRLWAPHARHVALCGDFNGWQGQDMTCRDGVWEITVPQAKQYDAYKYVVHGADGTVRWKADPYAFHAATRPETNSKVYDMGDYPWGDEQWQVQKRRADDPMNIYEVHLGSWRRKDNGDFYSYRESADALADYVRDMGYHYVELLPVTEYPLDDSWGYQCTGYFAPTSRYGTPHDFKYLVDRLHQAGIGVILDWVGAHFCKDAHGLMELDGTCLYEYADPLKWEHGGWGTRVFDYGKGEVRSFLLSSAAWWIREYHIDALRVDAVASMLYLDYDRCEWRPNRFGGRENEEAIAFLQEMNTMCHDLGALTAAEESTAWPGVTAPVSEGGLGFSMKWNMGWMNDVCHYLKMDPFFRQHHHRDITFSMMYAFSENFVLPVSHDEVVHMKGSLRGKMPGDDRCQLAGVRSFWAYMLCHPGKVLSFMGAELGQWHEWDFAGQLDWYLLDDPACAATHDCIRHLNHFYRAHPPLWENDRNWDGFSWIVADDKSSNVIVFSRRDRQGNELICAVNFAPSAWENYRFGVPAADGYREVCNTDEARWGGTGVTNDGLIGVEDTPSHGYDQSISVRIPPLGAVILEKTQERGCTAAAR
ncbi:MAG: 1,4-alpha-glucan branching protein GlgB [Clostridiales bacterium]|nr:1,4-alpha-glucan branching protein GlgB [Candidatus Cacconaster stercorequi]